MRSFEILVLLLIAFLLLTSGLFMLFGPWSLVGCGALLFIWTFFIDVKE